MFNNTKKFLLTSVSCLVVLCIIIFVWLGSVMGGKSHDAINEVGTLYMSEMSTQLQQKFDAVIELQVSRVEALIRRTPPESVSYGTEMIEELAFSADIREFKHLGLYRKDGGCETIYGESVRFLSEEEFQDVISDDEKFITSGYNESDEKLLLMMVDAAYPMKDGKTSDVIVAGIQMSYLEDALVLEGDSSMVYSHIIRKDGEFVVRSGDAFRDNYFSRLEETISLENSKAPDQYVDELKTAIDNKENYSALLEDMNGIHQHFYCAPLTATDWYLVSVMPYGDRKSVV